LAFPSILATVLFSVSLSAFLPGCASRKGFDENGKWTRVESDARGSLTHHRFLEMYGKLGEPGFKEAEINNGLGVPNHKKIFYKVVSLKAVMNDFREKILR
jgi:hypothetical protein